MADARIILIVAVSVLGGLFLRSPHYLRFGLLFAALAACLSGQDFSKRVGPSHLRPHVWSRHVLESMPAPSTAAPAAALDPSAIEAGAEVLGVAEAFLLPPVERFTADAVLRRNGKDVLTGRVHLGPSADGEPDGTPEGEAVRFWDDPGFIVFIFDLGAAQDMTEERVEETIRSVVDLRGGPRPVKAVRLFLRDDLRIQGPIVRADLEPEAQSALVMRGLEFAVDFMNRDDRSYAMVRIGKRLIPSRFFGRRVFVAERFPPLSERMRSWSFEDGLEQLQADPDERRTTILEGLLERELDLDQFLRCHDQYVNRGSAERSTFFFVQAAARSDRSVGYEAMVKELASQLLGRKESEPRLDGLLRAVRFVGEWDFEETALEALAAERGVGQALLYLGRRGSPASLPHLTNLAVDGGLEAFRRSAISEIRARAATP